MLKIIPNKKNIGAEIIVNLKDISNKDISKIKKALNKYGMLFFKEQMPCRVHENKFIFSHCIRCGPI